MRPCTVACIMILLKQSKWYIFDPPYSSDLALSDYHGFTGMKVWLAIYHYETNEELTDNINLLIGYSGGSIHQQGTAKACGIV